MTFKLIAVSALAAASFAFAESDVKNGTIGTGTMTGTDGRQTYPGNATNENVTVNRTGTSDSVRVSSSSAKKKDDRSGNARAETYPGKGPGRGAPEASTDVGTGGGANR
jgi:hypothetical protein